jgi:iron complex outermembrane receptor protein
VARKKLIPAMLFVLFHFSLSAQKNISLTGKITDINSNPVANATVHVLNTNLTLLSNEEGNYTIHDMAAGRVMISFSAIGYATLSKDVSLTSSSNNMDVQLKDATAQLDDVVVTAEKKEESVQKIPLSITVLSSKDVNDYRLWNSRELTAIVPNMYSNNSGDERNVTSVRGITTTSYDPAVATYIDGVNQFSLDTYINTLFDVERIEVLRGPQGTLYGRNAMGGVINIITKQPSNITNGFAEVNIGNHNQQRYTLAFRTPLIKDKLFLGVAGAV